jgi:hypothetical protein
MPLWGLIPAAVSAAAGVAQLFGGRDPEDEELLQRLKLQMDEGLSPEQEQALSRSLWGAAMPGLTSGQRRIAGMAASRGISSSNIPGMMVSNLWGEATSDISTRVGAADVAAMERGTEMYGGALGAVQAKEGALKSQAWGSLGESFGMAFDTLMTHFFPEDDLISQLFGEAEQTQEWYNPSNDTWNYGKNRPTWAE